jgi:hypothetical protein
MRQYYMITSPVRLGVIALQTSDPSSDQRGRPTCQAKEKKRKNLVMDPKGGPDTKTDRRP